MISERAAASFRRIFENAAAKRLCVGDASDGYDVIAHGADSHADSPYALKAERAVIVTISSIVFRVLLVIHAEDNPATRRYFTGAHDAVGSGEHDGGEGSSQFDDRLLEAANMCAGAISQALAVDFFDLGMSTPYVLDSQCEVHMDAVSPDLLHRFVVRLGAQRDVTVGVTLCVCTDAPLDFAADIVEEEEIGGELELF